MEDMSLCSLKWILTFSWIIFVTHRVSGQFDPNFTLQNVWGRVQPERRSLIQCQSDENHKRIKFSRMIDTGQGPKLPKSSQQFIQGKPVFARILFMPADDELGRVGVFQCKIVKNNVATRIVTFKLPASNLVELDAINPYNVVSVGDSVELEVNATKKLNLPIKWMLDGKPLPDWDGLLKVQLRDVEVSDGGIYECFYDGRRGESVHAIMRLFVRSCPEDLYGDECDQECPPCYNGGLCHDKWGLCVCPAGFSGDNCEIACGGNHFGADCSKFCSPPQNNSNTDELCALHLFCKPDPYGCSCAPGFKGSKCMAHCEPGWYGADCKQPCHCAYGISSCNRITGACDGGCARGWRGHSCQIEDPNSNSTYIETTTMMYCPTGTYGPSCERFCHCAGNEQCHIITGHCPSGCEDGWERPTCGSCKSGRFGEKCESTCHCEGGHHNCDKDGFCYSGCEGGWAGFTCQAECTPGRFGSNCASTCHCHENSTSPCDKITGDCPSDCEAGYMGKDCQTLCPPNTYGVNCVNPCVCTNGAQCNRVDGSCACEGRWRGLICNESEPQIVAANDLEVNTGQLAALNCLADAVPAPLMNVSSSELPGLEMRSIPLEQNQYMTTVKVKPEAAGKYEFRCTARNDHGFDLKEILMTVVDPPRLLTPPELVVKTNHSVTIRWDPWKFAVDEGGTPTYKVEYMVVYRVQGASDWTNANLWKGSLMVSEPTFAIGRLHAYTVYEIAVRSRRMREPADPGPPGVAGLPGPRLQVKTECGVSLPDGIPQEFLPDKISKTSVTLTWKNPSEESLLCSLVSYWITFHPEAEESIMSTTDTEDIQNSIEIDDLTPNTNYVVRVYPVTALEKSNYYAEIIIKTAETIPPPVYNLQWQALEDKPDLLLVTWEAPSDRNGAIKGYLVTYILLDRAQCGLPVEADEHRTRQMHSNDTEITLQNLYAYSTYNISVQARTSAGESEPASLLATTSESVPSEPPKNVRVISSTNDSLEFSWEAIPCEDSNGDIIYYEYAFIHNEDIVYVAHGLGRMKRSLQNISHVFDSVANLRVTIKNLKPYTAYEFMVAGVTAVGRGIFSDSIFHRTEEYVPSKPLYASPYLVKDNSIGLSWEQPEFRNGVITRYKILVLDIARTDFVSEVYYNVSENDDKTFKILLSNLKPATLYQLSIQAKTKAGWGETSYVQETTLDGVPDEPSEVSLLENTKTSLNLTWKEPLEKNGLIMGYKVTYRPISSLDPVFNATPFVEEHTEVDENITEILLDGLHPSTQYNIGVSAKTSAGYGHQAKLICWTIIQGDHVSPTLKILEIEATNETIPIIFSTTGSSSVHKYQVIVEYSLNNEPINENELSDYETAVVQKNLPYYIAAELDPRNVSQSGEQMFVVGDRQEWGGYKNVHLNPGHSYKISIRTIVIKDEEMKSVLTLARNETAGTTIFRVNPKRKDIFGLEPIAFILIVIGVFVFLIASTFLICFTVCYRRERKKSTISCSTKDSGLSGSMTWSVMYNVPVPQEGPLVMDGFRTFPLIDKNPSLKRSKSDSKIVHGLRVETLEDYLLSARSSNVLIEEFKRLVDGQISPWTVARKSCNAKKNRYGNILPYDRYRVALKTESSKSDADYINASYVDGFRRPREYIVTQGPLENTTIDFWRMVWQENSPVIVMVTDLVENGRKKCAKYWPDDSIDFGDLHILLIHSENYKDFTVRTILIRKVDEIGTHRVVQYQYTGWPDRTVPSNINSLIKFVKKVRDDHPVMAGPMVVHCSAGAGRSGTYVAIDALCQQAAEDRRVDVFRFVNNARHQRIHLVQTLEQYSFIYEALVEATQYEETSVPLDKIGNYLSELDHMSTIDRRSLILKQYNKLNRTQKKSEVNRCSVALSDVNIFKNRDPLTVPGDFERIKLEIDNPEEEKNDYINAVYVDAYKKPAAFLVTQMPMTHTVQDFWRLIYQQKSSLIVMLNSCDETEELNVGIYWPESGECCYGAYEVQLITYEEQGDFVIRIMRLSNHYKENEEPMKIILLQYNSWMSEMKPSSMLSLIEMTERWYERSSGGPITVHCVDGATRCGLFIAANHVCDQVESEGILDVFQIVKTIRSNRSEFIPNSDQYRLLFEVAQEVAEPYLLQLEEQNKRTKKLSIKI